MGLDFGKNMEGTIGRVLGGLGKRKRWLRGKARGRHGLQHAWDQGWFCLQGLIACLALSCKGHGSLIALIASRILIRLLLTPLWSPHPISFAFCCHMEVGWSMPLAGYVRDAGLMPAATPTDEV